MRQIKAKLLKMSDLRVVVAVPQVDGTVHHYVFSDGILAMLGDMGMIKEKVEKELMLELGEPVELLLLEQEETLLLFEELDPSLVNRRAYESMKKGGHSKRVIVERLIPKSRTLELLSKLLRVPVLLWNRFAEFMNLNVAVPFNRFRFRNEDSETREFMSFLYYEMLPIIDTNWAYRRDIDIAVNIAMKFEERQLEVALETFNAKLAMLADLGLISGYFKMPSVKIVTNPVGNDGKVLILFAMPIINMQQLNRLTNAPKDKALDFVNEVDKVNALGIGYAVREGGYARDLFDLEPYGNLVTKVVTLKFDETDVRGEIAKNWAEQQERRAALDAAFAKRMLDKK